MAFTEERYSEVDAELDAMWKRLIELAVEIDAAAPITNKQGFTYQAACAAGNAIAHLRHLLTDDQETQRIGEEIQRPINKHFRAFLTGSLQCLPGAFK